MRPTEPRSLDSSTHADITNRSKPASDHFRLADNTPGIVASSNVLRKL
jgi:hypothetical protein